MNLINVLCFIFLIACAFASSDGTSTSTEISSTDGITTDSSRPESTDTSDLSSDAPDSPDTFSDGIISTTPSYDTTTDPVTTKETTTDVVITEFEEITMKPGIVHPSLSPRANFEADSRLPKPLQPTSDGTGHELEMQEENKVDKGKRKPTNIINPSILTAEDSGEGPDSEILEGHNIDGSGTEKSLKNIDAGNESRVSKGKAAGILVSSCILAVALIWISKMVYTRYQSRTYDVRHDLEMRNP